MKTLRELWHGLWPAILVAAVGPLVIAERSLGESAPEDLLLLLCVLTVAAGVIVLVVQLLLPRLERSRRVAVGLVIVAALTLPVLLASELAQVLPLALVPRLRTTLGVTLLLSVTSVFWVFRSRAGVARTVTVAIIACGTVDGISVARIARAEIEVRRALATSPTARALRAWDADSAVRSFRTDARPDVFLFVMDGYAGDSLLLAEYGVDHRALRDSLSVLGFNTPGRYTSNYARTFASMSSILNFAHVASVESEALGRLQHAGGLQALITENRTFRLFAAAGYAVHWFPAPLFGGYRLPPLGAQVHRATRSWVRRRVLYSVLLSTWIERVWVPGVVAAALHLRPDVASAHFAGFDALRELAHDGVPSFAVVHLFSTHEPLLYDSACVGGRDVVSRVGEREAYAIAVRCQDAVLLQLFRRLIAANANGLVIAAIGDHAPSSLQFVEVDVAAERVPTAIAATRFDAGAFFYLSGGGRSKFRVPTSGVNVVPELLRAVFDAEPVLEPDTRFYSQPRPHPIHRFVPLDP